MDVWDFMDGTFERENGQSLYNDMCFGDWTHFYLFETRTSENMGCVLPSVLNVFVVVWLPKCFQCFFMVVWLPN